MSYFQPMITFTSSMDTSAVTLDLEMMCAQGMGFWVEREQQKVWMTRGWRRICEALPGRSGARVTVSSMYTSHLPLSSVGMEMMVDLNWMKGMVDGSGDGGGKEDWMG